MKRYALMIAMLSAGCIPVLAADPAPMKKAKKATPPNEFDALEIPERYKVLPVRSDLPPRIKKLVWIYMRQGSEFLAEEEDIKREEEYLVHYQDKTYVKYMLVKDLQRRLSINASKLEMELEDGSNPKRITGLKGTGAILQNRLSIASAWKP